MVKTLKKEMDRYWKEGARPCTACGQVKPFSDFAKSTRERLGHRSKCKECTSAQERAVYDPIRDRARGKLYREAHPEKARVRNAKWRAENLDRARERDAEWKRQNPERVRASSQRLYLRLAQDLKYRLQSAVKASIHAGLKKGSKMGRQAFALLGYSVDDLRKHLEGQFTEGMSWENYGRTGWHIDHKIPLAVFNYNSPDDIDFKRAWALSNLQPLWERENKSKGARLSGEFQPSLLLAA